MAVKPKVGTEEEYGNTFAYFEFDHPEGAPVIRHTFKLTTWELNWEIAPKAIVKPTDWPTGFKPYLKADESVKSADPFAKFAADMVRERKDATYDLDAVMGWLQENMTYDHSKASLTANAESAFKTRTGHCSDCHGLCSAFGRALGLPTRVAGLYVAVQEALEGAMTADYVPAETRGVGYGVLGAVNGVGDLVSSVAVGVLWTTVSPVLAFGLAGGVMLAGTLALAGQRDEVRAG